MGDSGVAATAGGTRPSALPAHPVPGIARAAFVLMAGNVASRLLGLVREQVIAGLYGRTGETDAFTIAFSVPSTAYEFLIGGMISAALVPVLVEYLDRGEDEFGRLAVSFATVAAGVLALAAGLMFLLAGPLLDVIGPGFEPDRRAFAVVLLEVMVPAVLLMGVAGSVQAVLYARQRFSLPAFGPAAFNLGIIGSAVALRGSLGVSALAVGVVVGAAAQLALQAPGLRRAGLRRRIDLRHPGLRRILALYLPVGAGLAISAAGVAIDRRLASFTLAGDPTAMRYATTLVQFPLGLVGVAVSTAILPALSRQSNAAERAAFRATLAYGLKLILLAIVPAAAALVVLCEPLVRLLFERGAFTATDTARTALAFLAYSPGLPAAALDQLLIFAFYARKKPAVPAAVGVVGIGVYLATALTLIGPFGMPGLAFANAVQWVTHTVIMLVLVWREFGGLQGLGLGAILGKTLLCGAGLAALLTLGWRVSAPLTADSAANGVVVVGLATVGAAIYVGALRAMGVQEVRDLLALPERLWKR